MYKDFEDLKVKLVKDIDEIIDMQMEDFRLCASIEKRTSMLENVQCWTWTRKEICNLKYDEKGYNYLVNYYEERGWKNEELDGIFHEVLTINQILGIIYELRHDYEHELKVDCMENPNSCWKNGWNSALDKVYDEVFKLIKD